jgi:hypothetical protein
LVQFACGLRPQSLIVFVCHNGFSVFFGGCLWHFYVTISVCVCVCERGPLIQRCDRTTAKFDISSRIFRSSPWKQTFTETKAFSEFLYRKKHNFYADYEHILHYSFPSSLCFFGHTEISILGHAKFF